MNGKYYMLVDDNKGGNGGIAGEQILWESDDGVHFPYSKVVITSGPIFDYCGMSAEDRFALMKTKPFCRNNPGKFERPAFLFKNGKPTCFYAPGGLNIHGGKSSKIYVLKIHE